MNKFIPKMYVKSIYDIDYKKLKKSGIKCIMFDLDNTLALIDEAEPPKKVLQFLKKLQREFDIYIISNNYKKRIEKFCQPFDCDFVFFSLKPSTLGLRRVKRKKNYQKSEMCIVGDQLVTDILAGNRFKVYTVLVDPLGEKDLKITSLNRYLENKILKKTARQGTLERGKYYE